MGSTITTCGSMRSPSPTPDNFYQCHGFHCARQDHIELAAAEWQSVRAVSAACRRCAGRAPATRARRSPAAAPGGTAHRHAAHQWTRHGGLIDGNPAGDLTQLDCIDESVNSWTYLTIMARAGFLKFHRVGPLSAANSLLVFHFRNTAVLVANADGALFAVDATLVDETEPPPIFPLTSGSRSGRRLFPPPTATHRPRTPKTPQAAPRSSLSALSNSKMAPGCPGATSATISSRSVEADLDHAIARLAHARRGGHRRLAHADIALLDLGVGHARVGESTVHRVGAALGERKVVGVRAGKVRLADENDARVVGLHLRRDEIDDALALGRQVRLVEVEIDVELARRRGGAAAGGGGGGGGGGAGFSLAQAPSSATMPTTTSKLINGRRMASSF